MKKLNKALIASICACALAVGCMGLVACGGSSSSDQSTAAADYTLATEGTLTVATSADYPPFEYLEDGEIKGFDAAMMTEVANRLGLKIELKNQAFDSLFTAVSGGSGIDCAASAITIDDERAEEIDYTESYYDSNLAVVVMADSKYEAKEELNGEPVGAQSGTSGESWAKENLKKSDYTPFQETPDLLQALRTGKVKAAIYDNPVAEAHVAGEYKDMKVLEVIPTGEQYGVIVSKENPGLTAAINQALADMTADGTMEKLVAEWLS